MCFFTLKLLHTMMWFLEHFCITREILAFKKIVQFVFFFQRLVENIEKKSATLGRDAVYTKTVSFLVATSSNRIQ